MALLLRSYVCPIGLYFPFPMHAPVEMSSLEHRLAIRVHTGALPTWQFLGAIGGHTFGLTIDHLGLPKTVAFSSVHPLLLTHIQGGQIPLRPLCNGGYFHKYN